MALSIHLVRLRPITEDHKDGPVQSILRLGSKHGSMVLQLKKIGMGRCRAERQRQVEAISCNKVKCYKLVMVFLIFQKLSVGVRLIALGSVDSSAWNNVRSLVPFSAPMFCIQLPAKPPGSAMLILNY
jgi:hypothetical protein